MICAYRHPNGISLNGREYLLDGGELAIFEHEHELIEFINMHNTGDKVETVEQLEEHGIFTEFAEIAVEDFYHHG